MKRIRRIEHGLHALRDFCGLTIEVIPEVCDQTCQGNILTEIVAAGIHISPLGMEDGRGALKSLYQKKGPLPHTEGALEKVADATKYY